MAPPCSTAQREREGRLTLKRNRDFGGGEGGRERGYVLLEVADGESKRERELSILARRIHPAASERLCAPLARAAVYCARNCSPITQLA
jgi:hypothetical protein